MDGLDGAFQGEPDTDFLKREIGLFLQEEAHVAAMAVENDRLATAAVMTGGNITGMTALLEELLDHAQRNPESVGHLLAGALVGVVGGQNPFPQIHRDGLHAPSLPRLRPNGYSFI